MPTERRTQAERRSATIGALLDATIACLAARGYSATTTAAICAEAGGSQGALFRHFPTRRDLMVAAAAHAGRLNVQAARTIGSEDLHTADGVLAALHRLHAVTLTPANQTWRELVMVARSDADLRAALMPSRLAFQQQMVDLAVDLWHGLLPAHEIPAVQTLVVNVLDGLAFSALEPDQDAPPGRTAQAGLTLLAQMIVARYQPQETR